MPKRVLRPVIPIAAILIAGMLASCQANPATPEVVSSPSALAPTPGVSVTTPATQAPPSSPAPSLESAATTSIPQGCTVVSPQPTLGPTEQSIFPPVTDKDWSEGPATADVTLLEYSDFQ